MKEEYNIELQWVDFPLHPETAMEGQSLEDLFAGRGLDIPGMLNKLATVAEQEGLPFGIRTMTYNSRRAMELSKFAEEQGRGEEFHAAMFHAYFADGLNIADFEVLGDIAAQVGLDREQAVEAVRSGRFAPLVDADWERSRRVGVMAVPTFMIGEETLVGAQPYPALAKFVETAGAQRRQ